MWRLSSGRAQTASMHASLHMVRQAQASPHVLTQAVQIPVDNCISWKIFTSDDGDELQPAMNKSEDSGSKNFQQRVQVRHTPCKGQLQILG